MTAQQITADTSSFISAADQAAAAATKATADQATAAASAQASTSQQAAASSALTALKADLDAYFQQITQPPGPNVIHDSMPEICGWSGETDGAMAEDASPTHPAYILARLQTRLVLRSQGHGAFFIARAMTECTKEVIDAAASAAGPAAAAEFVALLATKGGPILDAILAFFKSANGQLIISALVKILLTALGL